MLNLKYVAVEIRIRQREDDALSKILKTCHEKKFKNLKKACSTVPIYIEYGFLFNFEFPTLSI